MNQLSLLSRRALIAIAVAAPSACLLPSAAADAAGPLKPRMMRVQSLAVDSAQAPLTVRLRLPRQATLRAWVNGQRADAAFHRSGIDRRTALLTAHDGLRTGRNTLTLRAVLPNGNRDVETRRVRITEPLADAGPDRVVVAGAQIEVGSHPGGVGVVRGDDAPPAAPVRWAVTDAPDGVDVTLRDGQTVTPEATFDEPGTYVLRMTAGAGADASHDTLTVYARPEDPPIGVRLQTLSTDPAAAVWIDGSPQRDTYDRGGIHVVVLERRTRAVVEPGTTPRHGGGIAQLREIAAKYGGNDRYLMIVSSSQGTTSDVGGPLRALFTSLGVPRPSDATIAAITGGAPFSVVGIPGGVEGSAWTKFPGRGSAPRDANIDGYLQLNQAASGATPKHYDVVLPQHPLFQTRAGRPGAKSNTISWNGRDYSATLPSNATDGIHTLVIDPFSGAVIDNNALTTNGSDTEQQIGIAATWLHNHLQRRPAPLFVMQSIGSPSPRGRNWNAFADRIASIGGNRYVFNALDGRAGRSYALIGRPGSDAPALESSTTTGDDGELTGVAAPDRTLQLTPVAAGGEGDLNTELVAAAYQAPTAFPAFDTPGKRAAETAIGIALGFCESGSGSCDMRRRYHENYDAANWNQKSTDLAGLRFSGQGSTQEEFDAVKAQLSLELSAVSNIHHYFATLQTPFARAGGKSILDLQQIADRLKSEFATPPDTSGSWALGLVSQLVGLAGQIETGFSPALSGMSGIFSLVATLSEEDGKSILAEEITTRSNELGRELYDRYDLAQQAATGVGLLFVSDWGKMRLAASKLDNAWKLPAAITSVSGALNLSARRFFVESLVPTTFPYLLRATPKPGGPGTAIGTQCRLAIRTTLYWDHPWASIDRRSQVEVTEAINDDGSRRLTTLWPTRDMDTFPKSDKLSNLLFNATDARSAGLGLDPLAFFAPANFGGRVWSANDNARRCDLPFGN